MNPESRVTLRFNGGLLRALSAFTNRMIVFDDRRSQEEVTGLFADRTVSREMGCRFQVAGALMIKETRWQSENGKEGRRTLAVGGMICVGRSRCGGAEG